ncbi:MAG: DUF115 domain-containing protein [Spirochaetes bacterium]|nr:MAG: DUF115 domain-containing protein [Spirochaetota bacterium]
MTLLEKNLAVLKEFQPRLHDAVEAAAPDDSMRCVQARDGSPVPEITLAGKKLLLHSRYEPLKEAARLIDEVDAPAFTLFVVCGFAFAYHVQDLMDRAPAGSTVLVLEKDAAVIRLACECRDLSALFADRRLHVLIDPTEDIVAEELKGKSSMKVSFLTHRGSHQTDPAYYNNLVRIAKSYLSTKEVNIATLAKFEKTWCANIARNALELVGAPGADAFYGVFEGMPAIVVAAGPSLSMSIDFIRANADRALIVAVDTSYRVLRRHGIEPHFCMCVDPQLVNARYFEGDTPSRTVLVADPTVHPSVFRLFKGKRALTGLAFQMMKWIEEITGPRGELAYGGSVSTNAYDFARRLGASPVVMVAQDLAFTGGLAHARGSYLDEQVFLRTRRFYTPLMFNRFQLTALPPVYVRGIRTARVRTNQKMMIFHSWFEKRADDSLVNATWDGARMGAVRHVPHDELAFPAAGVDIFPKIDGLLGSAQAGRPAYAQTRERLAVRCAQMSAELDLLLPVLERAVTLAEDLLARTRTCRLDPGKTGYIVKKLEETDRIIESAHTLKEMIGFAAQRVIHTITEGWECAEGECELANDERVAQRSLYLYRGLLEGCVFNKKMIGKMHALLR